MVPWNFDDNVTTLGLFIILIIQTAAFSAFYWMLSNRIWALEQTWEHSYPPGTVIVRGGLKK